MSNSVFNDPFTTLADAPQSKMSIPDQLHKGANASPFSVIPGTSKDARTATRKRFNGRVKIIAAGNLVRGKVFDVSMTGASVLIEDLLSSGRKMVQIQFDIFHNGKSYVFDVPSAPVYSVLVSGSGYKIGVQFGTASEINALTLARLMET